MKKITIFILILLFATSCSPKTATNPAGGIDDSPGVTETPINEDLWQGTNGDTFYFTQGDSEGQVKVTKIGNGNCQYGYSGCDPINVGDKTVVLEVSVFNNGPASIEVDDTLFEVEYPDGTRVDTATGNAYQFSPDNEFDSRTIRSGGRYLGTLTFEVPNGIFSLVMLTDTYGGEDLAIWEIK